MKQQLWQRYRHFVRTCVMVAMGVSVFAMLVNLLFADTPQSWDFSNPPDYEVSHPDDVGVEADVARLKLHASEEHRLTIPDYLSGESSSGLSYGSDGMLQLAFTNGSYVSRGEFISRIFDGGLGNRWSELGVQAFNTQLGNAEGEVSSAASNLVFLVHANQSWQDVVSGQHGAPGGSSGTLSFTPQARLGSHAARFSSPVVGGRYVTYSPSISFSQQITFAFWVSRSTYSDRRFPDLLVYTVGGKTGGLVVGRDVGPINSLLLDIAGKKAYSPADTFTSNDYDQWKHVVITVDLARSPSVIFYVDSVQIGTDSMSASSIGTMTQLWLGSYQGQNPFDGSADEIAIFDRALTAEEVAALYLSPRSLVFRCRSGSSVAELESRSFVGPDGSEDSSYGASLVLANNADFFQLDRYVQYKATLAGQSDGLRTPVVDAVGFVGSRNDVYDNSRGDFVLGNFDDEIAVIPTISDAPRIGLGKRENGGFYTDGVFTSRTMDGGDGQVYWGDLIWRGPQAVSISGDERFLGVWHFEGDVLNEGTSVFSSQSHGISYTFNAKLGNRSAVFDSAYGEMNLTGNSVAALEVWILSKCSDCGLFDLGGGREVRLQGGLVKIDGFGADESTILVNGQPTARRIQPGWNHIVVTFPSRFAATESIEVGRIGSDYFEGAMDELAIYSTALDLAEYKQHYLAGGPGLAGRVRFRVRASNEFPIPDDEPFIDSNNNTNGYLTAVSSAFRLRLPTAVWNKRYFQYQAHLEGDANATPGVFGVTLTYSGTEVGSVVDDQAVDLAAGTFDGGRAALYGDSMTQPNMSTVPGLVNLDASSPLAAGAVALWHMDEDGWIGGQSVIDQLGSFHGTPLGSANTTPQAHVGARAGDFNGIDQAVSIPQISLGAEYTINMWFFSRATTRTALLSHDARGIAIEINSDGNGTVPGSLAVVVENTLGSVYKTVSMVNGLDDARWHHVSVVREGQMVLVYVDGVRAGGVHVSTFGPAPAGSLMLGHHLQLGSYFKGSLDEVSIFSRGLSGPEIRQLTADGSDTKNTGEFISDILDAGGPAIWEEIAWRENGRYDDPLQVTTDDGMLALWHFDETNGTTFADEVSGLSASGSGTANAAGQFGRCVTLAGGGLDVPGAGVGFEPDAITLEAWVNLTTVGEATFAEKKSGAAGYALGIDASGNPYFSVAGTVCTVPIGFRDGLWTHVAGTYDGSSLHLHLNGEVRASATLGGASLASGGALTIGAGVLGQMDEVCIHERALAMEEITDHARAGLGHLRFQIKVSNDPALADTFFIGPDRTGNTYFTLATGDTMVDKIPLGRYFQFRAEFESIDGGLTPALYGVTLRQSRYSTEKPWVAPTVTAYRPFVGNILSFNHVLMTNTDASVRYQLTGDMTNWYWWGGTEWEVAPTNLFPQLAWQFANPWYDVNAHIDTFYKDLYDKVGGRLRFKAFLSSSGNDQVAIDEVGFVASDGRINVLWPNGAETNDDALLTGVPYAITWATSGTVSDDLKIELSRDGGTTWQSAPIADHVPDTGRYEFWTTPLAETSQGIIRISDNQDATILDTSDGPFELVQRFRMLEANGGETWYMTENNVIRWASAYGLGGSCELRYAADGTNFNFIISDPLVGYPNIQGSDTNRFVWTALGGNQQPLPSENARLRVSTLGGQGVDASDSTFTLAGITITNPDSGAYVNRGKLLDLTWISSGAGTNVAVDFSLDNGVTWTTVVDVVTNVTGENHFDWLVDTAPSDTARLRMRSLSDPRVYGISAMFTLADIKVTSPVEGEAWQVGATNTITWLSGGAGDNVNIYYSTNSGAYWETVELNVRNVSGINSYDWIVVGFPTDVAQVQVQSTLDPDNLWSASPDFSIAGVRVLTPNGGEIWPLGKYNSIRWEYEAAGSDATVTFAYDGENFIEFPGSHHGLIDLAATYQPTNPTVRAKVRLLADDPYPFTNMWDESDDYFIVGGVVVSRPRMFDLFTVGQKHTITWTSAGALEMGGDGFAYVYYTTTGTDSNLVAKVGNNEAYPGGNVFQWTIDPDALPADAARIIVTAGPYRGQSDIFTLRGVRITNPTRGTLFDINSQVVVRWDSAGFDDSSAGHIYLSSDGGVTYPPELPANSINPAGVVFVNGAPAQEYVWMIPSNSIPTTNAVLKMVVTQSDATNDLGYTVLSRPFVMKGLKVIQPAGADEWEHDSTYTINYLSARAGSFVSAYYSFDGTNYDENLVFANDVPENGNNAVQWTIERSRTPTTMGRIKLVSDTGVETVSDAFTVKGVKVVRPIETDIWAETETNRIEWAGVGTDGTYELILVRPDNSEVPIASGISSDSYDWTVSLGSAGDGVRIKVSDPDSGYEAYSEPFRIVQEPTVIISRPGAGALWNVDGQFTISWSRGGQVENGFNVSYSVAPHTTIVPIATNILAAYDAGLNAYSFPWTVPDTLGEAYIYVQSTVPGQEDVKDTSDQFYIVGTFEVVTPNGGDQDVFALKNKIINWYTWGSVQYVDLFYSYDPLHGTNSWIKINREAPVEVQGYGTEPSAYTWTVPHLADDVPSVDTVRIRVQQAGVPGADDDSDADFPVRYYDVTWNVYDEQKVTPLDKLSVVDSSAWSESNLESPIQHFYPFGYFDTVWSREFFYDNVIFNWETTTPIMTNDVPMEQSKIEPDYKVMADFTYETLSTNFLVQSWLERSGVILETAEKCVVKVFDKNGDQIDLVESISPQAGGVFWMNWDVAATASRLGRTFDDRDVFFARVEITFSGTTYSSGVTFTLRVAASSLTLDTLEENTRTLISDLAQIDSNVTGVARGISGIRGALTNLTRDVKGAESNIVSKINQNRQLLTNIVDGIAEVTNTVGLLLPLTNLAAQVTNLIDDVVAARATILTRPREIASGDTVTILYKTRPNYGPTEVDITVSPAGYAGKMTEVVPGMGIYEHELTVNTTWGEGAYTVTCQDPLAADQMTVAVVSESFTSVGDMLVGISNSIGQIELRMTNITASIRNVSNLDVAVSDILWGVSNIQATVGSLTNLDEVTDILRNVQWDAISNLTEIGAAMTNMENSVNEMKVTVDKLTNFSDVVDIITGAEDDFNAITNVYAILERLNGIGLTVSNTSDAVGALTNLDAIVATLDNVDWNSLSNIQYVAEDVTNILARVIDTQGTLAGLTNLSDVAETLAGIDWGPISNIATMATDVTNILARVKNTEAIVGAMTNLEDVVDTLAAVDWGAISNLSSMASTLDTIEGSVSNVYDVVRDMEGLPDLATNMTALITQFDAANFPALSSQLSNVVTSVDGLEGLTNVYLQITNLIAAVNSMEDLSTLQSNVSALVSTLGDVELAQFGSNMTNLTAAITAMGDLSEIRDNITNLASVVAGMEDLATLQTNVSDLVSTFQGVDLLALGNGVTNLLGAMQAIGDLAPVSDNISNLVNAVQGLPDLAGLDGNISNMVAILQGVELGDLGIGITNLADVIQKMGSLDEIRDNITNLVGVVGSLDELNTLQTNVAALVATMGGVDLSQFGDDMTNMTAAIRAMGELDSIRDSITNLAAVATSLQGLGGLQTNVAALVAALGDTDMSLLGANITNLTSSIAALGSLDGIRDNITNLVDVVASLQGLDGLQTNVAALVAALGDTDMSLLGANITNLTSAIAAMGNLDDIRDNITNLVGVVDSLQGLEGLQTNVSALVSAFSGVNLGAFGDNMTNLTTAINAMGNLDDIRDNITNLVGVVASLQGLDGLQTNVAALVSAFSGVNLGAFGDNMTNLTTAINAMGNLDDIRDNITNLAAVVASMSDLSILATNVTDLVDVFDGVNLAEFGVDMTNMTAALRAMGNLDEIRDNITNLVGVVESMKDLTTLQTNVADLVAALATTDLGVLGNSLTNLTGAIQSMGSLDEIRDNITNLVGVVDSLSDLDALQTNVVALVESLKGIDLRDFGESMTNLQATIAGLGDLSDLYAQMSNVISAAGQLTNVQDVVDAIAGIDFDILRNIDSLANGVTNILTTVTDMNAIVGDLTNLQTVVAALGGVNWDAVTNVAGLSDQVKVITDSLGDVKLTDLAANVNTLTNRIGTSIDDWTFVHDGTSLHTEMLEEIERKLGRLTDNSNENTFFGRLAALNASVTGLAGTSAETARNAKLAKTQAGDAASGVGLVRRMLEEGDFAGAVTRLNEIKTSLTEARSQVGEISKKLPTEQYRSEVLDTCSKVREIYEKSGVDGWEKLVPGLAKAGAPGEGEGEGGPGAPEKETVEQLNTKMKDVKDSLDFMRKLMDEMRYEPVVETTLLGGS